MSLLSDAVRTSHARPDLDEPALQALALDLADEGRPAHLTAVGALDLLISCVDLTALSPTDTEATISDLVARALSPDPQDPSCPHTAAVCVHSDRVDDARAVLRASSPVRLAAVSGGFPHGRVPLPARIVETQCALDSGAQEIDMVLDRAAFLSGDRDTAALSILEMAECVHDSGALLKVILETGELADPALMRDAAFLAMACGADFIKTSTGKSAVSATPVSTLVLMRAAHDWFSDTGRLVGVKPAGGFTTAAQAMALLPMAQATLGSQWLSPSLLRIGASSLLSALTAARAQHLGRSGLAAAQPAGAY